MTGKQVIKILEFHGWAHIRTRGSHHLMWKKGYRSVPIPVHGKKDLGRGLLSKIEKQVGLKLK